MLKQHACILPQSQGQSKVIKFRTVEPKHTAVCSVKRSLFPIDSCQSWQQTASEIFCQVHFSLVRGGKFFNEQNQLFQLIDRKVLSAVFFFYPVQDLKVSQSQHSSYTHTHTHTHTHTQTHTHTHKHTHREKCSYLLLLFITTLYGFKSTERNLNWVNSLDKLHCGESFLDALFVTLKQMPDTFM